MKFPYKPFRVEGSDAAGPALPYRPAVPVRIIGPSGGYSTYGLLDTGADDTYLPIFLLDQIGLPIPRGPKITILGIGADAMTVVFATVDIELRRGKVAYRWAATVGFHAGHRILLGQSGVLEHFLATFNHRQRYAPLQANGPLPPPVMSQA